MDFNISRFLIKQNALDLDESPPYSNYERALNEIKNGRKTSHWIWYIFPQGPFGISETSKHFSISSIDEGLAYLSLFVSHLLSTRGRLAHTTSETLRRAKCFLVFSQRWLKAVFPYSLTIKKQKLSLYFCLY